MSTIGCFTGSLCSGSSGFIGCGYEFGPLFVGQKDLKAINCWNAELIQNIIGQYIYYHRVDPIRTKANIYGESKRKNFLNPIKIFARVEKQEPTQTFNEFGLDQTDKVTIYFDKFQLWRFNIKPTVGDYISFGETNRTTYEILTVYSWQPVYGSVDDEILCKADCENTHQKQGPIELDEEEYK